jgi:hypothetical protein
MTFNVEIQQENLLQQQIKDLLIYFTKFRGMKNRALAQRIRYEENFLTNVRKGNTKGGEKLLRALEDFYILDNLKQMQEIDRKIDDLKREKGVLQEQTIEKFYEERGKTAAEELRLARLNEAGQNKPKLSLDQLGAGELLAEAMVAKDLRAVSVPAATPPKTVRAAAPSKRTVARAKGRPSRSRVP